MGSFIENVKDAEFEDVKQSRGQNTGWVIHMEFYITWHKGGTWERERNCKSGTKVFRE